MLESINVQMFVYHDEKRTQAIGVYSEIVDCHFPLTKVFRFPLPSCSTTQYDRSYLESESSIQHHMIHIGGPSNRYLITSTSH